MSTTRYKAKVPLPWGDGRLAVGDPVPDDEPGRDYAGMVQRGEIETARGEGADPGLAARLAELEARVARLEGTAQVGRPQQRRE